MKKISIALVLLFSMFTSQVLAAGLVVASPPPAINNGFTRQEMTELVEMDVVVPSLSDLEDKKAQDAINDLLVTAAKDEIRSIEARAEVTKKRATEMGIDFHPAQLNISYTPYNENQILSFVVRTYAMDSGAAHGTTKLDTYNIEVESGRKLLLKDLFAEGYDYIGALNQVIREEIANEAEDGRGFFKGEDGFKGIQASQAFSVTPKALQVHFDAYLLAPGASGPITFEVTWSQLAVKEGLDFMQDLEKSYYTKVTGTIESIEEKDNGIRAVEIKDCQSNPAYLMVGPDTYIHDGELGIGKEVTGYLPADQPMILIYPAQYPVEVISFASDTEFFDVDHYGTNLINDAFSLELNLSKDTEITDKMGKSSDQDLGGANLLVVYRESTRSIPAQTTPIQVVVLSGPSTIDSIPVDMAVEDIKLVVGNQTLEEKMIRKDGQVLVPLRAVGESLAYRVDWDPKTERIQLGTATWVDLANEQILVGYRTPMDLEETPVLRAGRTYVGLEDLREIFFLAGIDYIDGQLLIQK